MNIRLAQTLNKLEIALKGNFHKDKIDELYDELMGFEIEIEDKEFPRYDRLAKEALETLTTPEKPTDEDLKYSRFDVPDPVKEFLNTATAVGLTDPADVVRLTLNHGTNWEALIDDVVGWAFSDFHCHKGREIHRKISIAADQSLMKLRK